MTKDRKPVPSPKKQLENVHKGLGDGIFEAPAQASEEDKERATRVFQNALKKALDRPKDEGQGK